MASTKKTAEQTIDALLAFSSEHDDETTARAELEADGVDVADFLAKVRTRIDQAQDEKRLAWLHEGRRALGALQVRDRAARYEGLSRGELEARLRSRPVGPSEASAHFHKLETLTDDDIRSLLADLDELDESSEG
jgi:hypothetical protein